VRFPFPSCSAHNCRWFQVRWTFPAGYPLLNYSPYTVTCMPDSGLLDPHLPPTQWPHLAIPHALPVALRCAILTLNLPRFFPIVSFFHYSLYSGCLSPLRKDHLPAAVYHPCCLLLYTVVAIQPPTILYFGMLLICQRTKFNSNANRFLFRWTTAYDVPVRHPVSRFSRTFCVVPVVHRSRFG